ncbi:MAG: hypothetical protein FJ270_02520 [Planctomycetes bacterium]|nr:hypothetical protein [Planctomycetota bacterium]
MFEPPDEAAPLPSARVRAEPASITIGGQLRLEPAPNHRRDYLDAPAAPRQPSGGHGTLRRIAAGSWCSDGRLITLRQDHGDNQTWLALPSAAELTLERIA